VLKAHYLAVPINGCLYPLSITISDGMRNILHIFVHNAFAYFSTELFKWLVLIGDYNRQF